MLDEQQVANQTALTEADIRCIVRSELERRFAGSSGC